MGWSGRAPAPPASNAMADTRKAAVAVVGIDIGNIVRLDERVAIALRQIAAWPVGITICHRAALPRRHEGLRQRARIM